MLAGENPDRLPSPAQVEQVFGASLSTSLSALEDMEEHVRHTLNSDTSAISALRCLKLFLERLGADFHDPDLLSLVGGKSVEYMLDAVADMSLFHYSPSVVAAAMLYSCRRVRGTVPAWPLALETLTGFKENQNSEFGSAVKATDNLLMKKKVFGSPVSSFDFDNIDHP